RRQDPASGRLPPRECHKAKDPPPGREAPGLGPNRDSGGLASWFSADCHGKAAVGESLEFQWDDGSMEQFRVRRLGAKRSSVAFAWRRGTEWRIYLHGR